MRQSSTPSGQRLPDSERQQMVHACLERQKGAESEPYASGQNSAAVIESNTMAIATLTARSAEIVYPGRRR